MAAKTISQLAIKLNLSAEGVRRGVDQLARPLKKFAGYGDEVNDKFKRGNRQLSLFQKTLGGLKNFLNSAIGRFAAFGAAIAAGRLAIAKLNDHLQEVDAHGKFARRIGIANERLSVLKTNAELNGFAINSLETSLQRMVRRVAEAAGGTGAAVKALQELGLSAQALARMKPDQQYKAIADAMAAIGNQGDRVRLTMSIFDTEGVAGLPALLALSGEGLAKVTQQTYDWGTAISEIDVERVERMNDQLTQSKARMDGVWKSTLSLIDAGGGFIWLNQQLMLIQGTLESITDLIHQALSDVSGLMRSGPGGLIAAGMTRGTRGERVRGRALDDLIRQANERLAAQMETGDAKQIELAQRNEALQKQQVELAKQRLRQGRINVQEVRLR